MKNPKRLFMRMRNNLRAAIKEPEGGFVSVHLKPEEAAEFEEWLIWYLADGKAGRPVGATSGSKYDAAQMHQVTRLLAARWQWKPIAGRMGWNKSIDALKKAHKSYTRAQEKAGGLDEATIVKSIKRNVKSIGRRLKRRLKNTPLPSPRKLRVKKP